jgi:hypothetical protein
VRCVLEIALMTRKASLHSACRELLTRALPARLQHGWAH